MGLRQRLLHEQRLRNAKAHVYLGSGDYPSVTGAQRTKKDVWETC